MSYFIANLYEMAMYHQHLFGEDVQLHAFATLEPATRYGIPDSLVIVAIIDSAYGTGVACGSGSALQFC